MPEYEPKAARNHSVTLSPCHLVTLSSSGLAPQQQQGLIILQFALAGITSHGGGHLFGAALQGQLRPRATQDFTQPIDAEHLPPAWSEGFRVAVGVQNEGLA